MIESLSRYRSYVWYHYTMKVQHIKDDGFDQIKWFRMKAISVSDAIDRLRALVYPLPADEIMIVLGCYEKNSYVGDYTGRKIDIP